MTLQRRPFLQWLVSGAAGSPLLGCMDEVSDNADAAMSADGAAPTEGIPANPPTLTNASTDQRVAAVASAVDPDADWLARSTAPGVFRAFHFNDSSQLGAFINGAGDAGAWQTADWFHQAGSSANPTIAIDQKCSGTGSLCFEIPSNSAAGAPGNWQAHFGSAGDLRLVGENSEMYISWRQRWNAAMKTIAGQNEGVKFSGLEVGRRTSYNGSGSFEWSGSNENGPGITMQGAGASTVPIHYTTWFRRDESGVREGPAAEMYSFVPANGSVVDLDKQNGYGGGGACLYGGSFVTGEWVNECWTMPTDEWVTFKYHIKVLGRRSGAPWNNQYWDVEHRFYAARLNGAFELLWKWDATVRGYGPTYCGDPTLDMRYGKFRLMPYITGKNPATAHAPGKVWCDEVIFSTQDIAAPGIPAWRRGLAVNQLHALTGTQRFNSAAGNLADIINAWCGFGVDGSTLYSAAGSGHGSWWNPVFKLDLSASTPAWVPLDFGSAVDSIVEAAPYYTDGRPTGRHNYYSCVYTSAGGVPRIVLPSCDANYSRAGNSSESACDAYRLDGYASGPAGTAWEAAGGSSLWPAQPDALVDIASPAVAVHPTNGLIYCMSQVVGPNGADRAFRTLDPATKTWSVKHVTTPSYPSLGMSPIWRNVGSVIDAGRNKWVSLNGYDAFGGGAVTPRLVRIDLATFATTQIALSGDVPPIAEGQAIAHNTDDGHYYALVSNSALGYTRIYKINPDTGASTQLLSTTTRAHIVEGGNAPQSRFQYHSALRGFSWAPQWDSPVYFFPVEFLTA